MMPHETVTATTLIAEHDRAADSWPLTVLSDN
jgi:hypothetical protein